MNLRKVALWQAGGLLLLAGTLSRLAFSAADARTQAAAILAELTKKPDAQRVASEPLAKAQAALKRADQMRAAGDQKHGTMLEQAALEWATASQFLDKTARTERQLAELQTRATELETRVFRAQALVEQMVARRARAEEALHQLEQKGKP